MANLLGQNIGTNYKGILNLNTLNGNLLATLQAVTDGDGNASPLQLSTTQVNVAGDLTTQSQYIVNNLRVGGTLYFGNFKSNITFNGDNNLLLKNAAETSFGLLQFGGTTSAFPAIARSGANAVICLADAAAGAGLGVGMASATGLAATAILQADSTTKGFLPPRMTTAQKSAIVTPAAGLVVYDTTLNKLAVYTTAWETVTSV